MVKRAYLDVLPEAIRAGSGHISRPGAIIPPCSSATQAVLPCHAADVQDSSILTEHVPGDPQFSTLREQKLFKRYLTVFNRRVLFPATEDRQVRHLAGNCYKYCRCGSEGSRLGIHHACSMIYRSGCLPRLPGQEAHAQSAQLPHCTMCCAGCCS